MSKQCLCCGADADSDAPTCPACGSADFTPVAAPADDAPSDSTTVPAAKKRR